MWTDSRFQLIHDLASYVGADGTWYPPSWDKSTIPGLTKVQETDPPAVSAPQIAVSTIQLVDGAPALVWQIVASPNHPLYGVTDVALARDILAAQVVAELETRSSAAFAFWPAHERNTFDQQVAEAKAYLADNQAATPLLDAIKLSSETKAELAEAIIDHADAYSSVMGALMGAKRQHLAAIVEADLATLNDYDVYAGWPA